MRYRLPLLVLLVVVALPVAWYSCQRNPGTEATVSTPVEASAPAVADTSTNSDLQAVAAAATSAAAQAAVSTLHAYLGALPGPDRSRADAYWAGTGPGQRPGDAALRAIADLRSMRIQNEPPLALDRQSPPGAYEIPVDLRLDTDTGPGRMTGSYRLRARVDGQGWEITSASLQPVMD